MIAARSLLKGALLAGMALGLSGAASAYDELPRGLAKLTVADVVERITVEDEALEPHIVVSTQQVWDRSRRVEGAHASDIHLRAMIDRESGAVRWQVWHDLIYPSAMRDIQDVHYLVDGELQQGELAFVRQWLDDCPGPDAVAISCTQHTRLVFEVPDRVVADIAAKVDPGSRTPWRLRFKDEHGAAITSGLAPVEVAGLVEVVESLRTAPAFGG